MTSTPWRAAQEATSVRVALVVLFIGLGQAYYDWLRSLGMSIGTTLALCAITIGTAVVVTLVLWLAAERSFHLLTWLPVAILIPAGLGGLAGLATGAAGLYPAIVTGAGLGISVVAVTGIVRARRRLPQRTS